MQSRPQTGDAADAVKMRRRDRAKGEEWIRRFLERASFGFLAIIDEGRPFLNSNLFAYDPSVHALYFHTARVGRTSGNVQAGGAATFSVAVMGRLLPAPEALEFSVEYSSVVAFGVIAAVEEEAEKERALYLMMAKYAPHLEAGRDYRPITPEEMRRTAVHRLSIESWSGKEKVAASDHPGAFTVPVLSPPAVPEES